MRRRARTDGNHSAIRKALREEGCVVEDTSDVGRGFPDLLIRTPAGTVLLVEIKNPEQPRCRRKLRSQQEAVALRWKASYVVIETEAAARAVARR